MTENLFWLSFFALWWLFLLSVVEPTFLSLSSLMLFGLLGVCLAVDRGAQADKKEKGK